MEYQRIDGCVLKPAQSAIHSGLATRSPVQSFSFSSPLVWLNGEDSKVLEEEGGIKWKEPGSLNNAPYSAAIWTLEEGNQTLKSSN